MYVTFVILFFAAPLDGLQQAIRKVPLQLPHAASNKKKAGLRPPASAPSPKVASRCKAGKAEGEGGSVSFALGYLL
jgi:hypothetical protein